MHRTRGAAAAISGSDAFAGLASTGSNFAAARTKLRALRNTYGHHAVLEIRVNLARSKLIAEQEVPPIGGRANIGVQGLHLILRRDSDPAFDQKTVAFDAQVQPVFRHTRHVRLKRDALVSLEDIDGRPQRGLSAHGAAVALGPDVAVGAGTCNFGLVVHGSSITLFSEFRSAAAWTTRAAARGSRRCLRDR